jgi:C-terminal processing protease CtpA/Prc
MVGLIVLVIAAGASFYILRHNAAEKGREGARNERAAERARVQTDRRSGTYIGLRLEPDSRPAKIRSVAPNSPAATAGLRAGDRIQSVDGSSVSQLDPTIVAALIRDRPIGSSATLVIDRSGTTVTSSIVVSKRPTRKR